MPVIGGHGGVSPSPAVSAIGSIPVMEDSTSAREGHSGDGRWVQMWSVLVEEWAVGLGVGLPGELGFFGDCGKHFS